MTGAYIALLGPADAEHHWRTTLGPGDTFTSVPAAAPAAMTPEQAAVWAYPQPDFTDDEIAFTLCGALLGRVRLSGHLDQMSRQQRALVADAVRV